MPLFEASWSDRPSLLLQADTIGQALAHIHQEVGQAPLFRLQTIHEILPDNFLLVRRCGTIFADSIPSYEFCPDAPIRMFHVQRHGDREECVIAVEHITELPALLLWHFDVISEEECLLDERIQELWDAHHAEFSLLEIDTQRSGILMRYRYCKCPSSPLPLPSPQLTQNSE